MIEVICFHFVNREEGESAGWTADITQLLFPGREGVALSLHLLGAGLLGCRESQGTPTLGREAVSLDRTAPGSPGTTDLEEKGPCFVHHPAKNRDLHWGNTRPQSRMRFTPRGLCLLPADSQTSPSASLTVLELDGGR